MDLGPIKTPGEFLVLRALGWLTVGGGVLYAVLWVTAGRLPTIWPLILVLIFDFLVAKPLRKRACIKQLAQLREIDFRVCPACHYDLRSLPTEGECPECGKAAGTLKA